MSDSADSTVPLSRMRDVAPHDDTHTRSQPPAPEATVVDPHDRATLTVTEAAHVLGISRSTAYELVHAGTLPALRLGRRIVVPTRALEQLLDSPISPG